MHVYMEIGFLKEKAINCSLGVQMDWLTLFSSVTLYSGQGSRVHGIGTVFADLILPHLSHARACDKLCLRYMLQKLSNYARSMYSYRWAWPASKRGDGLQPYLAFVLAAENHAAPIRLQTAYIT